MTFSLTPWDFSRILFDLAARMLASPPGRSKPQTAVVNRAEAGATANQQGVHFSGPPQFRPIGGARSENRADSPARTLLTTRARRVRRRPSAKGGSKWTEHR